MNIEVWLTFVITASIILVVPGPTIIYVVGQSLIHGQKASLPLSIGVISGDAVCIILSLLGLSTLLSLFSTALADTVWVNALKSRIIFPHKAYKNSPSAQLSK